MLAKILLPAHNMRMQFVKRVMRWLFSSAFKLLIVMTAISAAIVGIIGSSGPIKQAVDQSGLYDKFADILLTELKKQSGENTIPFGTEIISTVVKNTLTAERVKVLGEKVIDSGFAYVDGKSNTLALSIRDDKQQIASGIASYIENRLNGLQLCTRQQALLFTNEVNPFTIPCRPSGLNTSVEKQRFITEFMEGKEIPNDFNVDFSKEVDANLNKAASSIDIPVVKQLLQPYTQKQAAQKAYDLILKLPIIAAVLALIFGIGSILLHDQKRAGIHNMATTFFGSGVFLVLGAVVSNWMVRNIGGAGVSPGVDTGQAAQQVMNSVVANLTGVFNQTLIKFGIGYAVFGILVLIVMHVTRPKKAPEQKDGADNAADEHKTTQTESPTSDPQAENQDEPKNSKHKTLPEHLPDFERHKTG
jgi:hypothetical protein